MENYIEFQNVTKIFPGHTALKNVSFSVKKGEVHALLGENGAGKSTLLNIFHGVFQATEGEVLIDGKPVNFQSAHEAIEYGIAKVHQEINAIPELTVAENIMLGKEISKGLLLNKGEMIRQTQPLLDSLGCTFRAQDKMKQLSAGQKQMVGIAKALHTKAKIISFDEPTASLSDSEVSKLFDIINDLKKQGITILYISHKLNEIFELCDRATILRDGEYITTVNVNETDQDTLIRAMVGRDVSMFARRMMPPAVQKDQTVLSISQLSGVSFHSVSFDLKKGEILGFFGLVGAGRTEVMRAVFGADPALGGTVTLNGRPLNFNCPNKTIRSGIGLIPENRKEEGFVKNLNNMDNIFLPCVDKFLKGIFIQKKAKIENAVRAGGLVGVTPNDPEFMTASLSGGNAQKVILAKWVSSNSQVLIFDEPTKGIDIGAKSEIYKLMETMVAQGKSIIMVSSELTEIIGMSDRVLIMREGSIVKELENGPFDEEIILAYAVGGHTGEKANETVSA